ncbi:hypothetical protein D4764_04G0014040 [Takifugu flavidus]|uniref:Uncharacterized protein n=1 Tax=Takifugu flavidus TaxID=433684 RepID=A0A5C6NAT8_9TELE|nr:hypothetical protein D4764_04G0014040 [Takifugu flavidus]
MINFVIVSSDLRPYVLDNRVKRGAELSTDHHLVVSWLRWWGRMLDRSGRPKRIVRVYWECLAESPVRRSFNSHLRESFDHVLGEAGDIVSEWTMFRASIVEAVLWPQGGWCLSWRQCPKLLVDTSADRYWQAKRSAATAVAEAKTWAWEEFGEAMENLLRESGVQGPYQSAPYDVVLLASSARDFQRSLDRFTVECEAAKMRISTSKSEAMEEILPQVEEFKFLGVLFTSEGRMEQEIDRRIGAASVVMRTLHRSVVVKRELSQKAKLLIYRSIFVPTLTYGWLGSPYRVRSSAIWEELGVEPLLLCVGRNQMRRPPGRPRTRWRDYVFQLVWERLGIPLDELEEVAGEREVWASLLRLLPPRPDPG